MQDWVVVTLAAFVYSLVMFAFDRVFKLDEQREAMREFAEKIRSDPTTISEEEITKHTKDMYRVMGMRIAMLFIVFSPIHYVFSSRYGDVVTPLGVGMHWLWWFAISSVVAQIFIRGVRRWFVLLRGG